MMACISIVTWGLRKGECVVARDMDASNRVLVVDDLSAACELIAVVLNMRGYEVVTAGNGAEALELAAAQHYSLAMIDLGLPDADGKAVLKKMRGLDAMAGAKYVVLTGEVSMAAEDRYRAAGFDGCLMKPFTPEELIALVTLLCPV